MRRSSLGLSACLVSFVMLGSAAADTSAGGVTATAPPPARNAVYVELAGNGGFYTVNYERFIRPDASIRAGLMYMSVSATAGGSSASSSWTSVPLMFQYLGVANGSHALELAGGLSLMHFSAGASTFDAAAMSSGFVPVPTATIGYRYSSPEGGFLFRAGYTPLFFVTTEVKDVFHWGGLSFGYKF